MTQRADLYLIRHAQSDANVDVSILKNITNVSVNITELGHDQASQAAKRMAEEFKQTCMSANKIFKIWNSPYKRTRTTAGILKMALIQEGIPYLEEETIYISERQFGIVDDAPDYTQTHSAEYAHFIMHKENKQDFFVRPPLGESPYDVCLRVDFFLKAILTPQKIDENSGKEIVHVLVSHGAAIRSLITMHMGLTYEKYAAMENPANASISKISKELGLEYEWFKPNL